MKLMTWDIDKGGREEINSIIEKIERENCDIIVLTGFRINHNKNKILVELKSIGYTYLIYKKVANKYQDTILIASKEEFSVEKNSGSVKDSFLIIKKNDIYIAGMNFTHDITQKDLVKIFNKQLSSFSDKKLIVAGNMQTAKNYASKNSLNKKLCKKYINFNDMGLKNAIEEMVNYNPDEYTWSANKGAEYNVDFILINNKMSEDNVYAYYNHDVKNVGISSHSMILFNIFNE